MEAIIVAAPAKRRLVLTVLAETGARVSEVCNLEWSDVDQAGERFRVRTGKTAAARRWVPISSELVAEIVRETPPDDRTGRIFPGVTPAVVQNVMKRACQSAGIPHFHPHDLPHRWISVQHKRGVPMTEISAHVGHSRTSLTWDTYSHVMIDEE